MAKKISKKDAKRKDQQLTKNAKAILNQIYDSSDLTIKQILSAGVVAFAELPPDKKVEYISKSQMGEYKLTTIQTDVFFDNLNKALKNASKESGYSDDDLKLVSLLLKLFGSDAMQSVQSAVSDHNAAVAASHKEP